MTGTSAEIVRKFRPEDRAAVRNICVQTAWMGSLGAGHVPDGDLWAEFWTRYFTDREPQQTWVVESAATARVIGYLTGTADARRPAAFARRMLPTWGLRVLTGGLLRRRASRRALWSLVRAMFRGELVVQPDVLATHPASLHFNLLPEARRRGLGERLHAAFLARLKLSQVAGIHVQTLSINTGANRFFQRHGYQIVQSRATSAFEHATPEPIEIVTWARRL